MKSLQDFQTMNHTQLAQVNGGKRVYIPNGNGAWLDSNIGKGGVDWNVAVPALGSIMVNGWAQNGPLAHLHP